MTLTALAVTLALAVLALRARARRRSGTRGRYVVTIDRLAPLVALRNEENRP